jgi:signal transduction histidine kinase
MNVTSSVPSHVLGANPWSKIPTSINGLFAHPLSRKIGLGLIAALGYYLGTRLGFALTPVQSPISTLWPPNAILLAVLLLTPIRNWWIPILAVLPVHLLIQLGIGIPVATSLGWFIGNATEALLGATIICRFVDPTRMFETVRGTLIFLCFGVVIAPLATSFVDAATVIFTGWGQHYWSLWTERLFSNALAQLIIVPVILTFWMNTRTWIKEATPLRYLEASALGMGLLLVSLLVFSFEDANHASPALIYLPLSFLLWAALRFGLAGLSVAVSIIALTAFEGAMHGKGPFTSASMEINVLSLQILLGTVATPLMLLSAMTTERRKMERSLREIAQKLIRAQEGERERIARELHDDIGQQLAFVESGLHELTSETEGSHKPEIIVLTEKVAEVSRSARELSHGLHPSSIEHLGLESALKRLSLDVATRKSIQVHFRAEGLKPVTPPDVALCLYRISQEALQNVVRHSGASEVSVNLVEQKGLIQLRISDNGAGFEVEKLKHAGLGLIGMRERLHPLRGDMQIYSFPRAGTTVEITIPLNPIL